MSDEKGAKIELRSEEVQELMGQIPPKILRWGITVIAVLLIGLFAGSCFFKYPDTLTADVTVTTAAPPVELYTMATGKLEYVNAKSLQHVKAGDILAVVESTADYRDVEYTERTVFQWSEGGLSEDELFRQLQGQRLSLGDIQPVFASFINALSSHIHHCKEKYYPSKIDIRGSLCHQRGKMKNSRENEFAIHKQQAFIAAKMYQRDSTLYAMELISEEELNNAENNYLQSRQTAVNDVNTQSQIMIEELQDKEAMLDLRQQYWQEKTQAEMDLTVSHEQLSNAIRQYERNYVLRAPIAGIINMMGQWKVHQFVESGTLMIIIMPDGSPVSIGRAKLPAAGAGKVKVGQQVKVRLSNFPDTEYGHVKGIVTAVSDIPDKDSNYFLEISFPEGLSTNYGKILPPLKQMVGSAEIIVKDKRLIENILEPIGKVLRD